MNRPGQSLKLLDRLLRGLVTKGTLAISAPGDWQRAYGTPVAGYEDIAIRFTDRKVARDIVTDPWLGPAEAFMDGRIEILEGDIFGLLDLLRANRPWDAGETMPVAGPLRGLLQRGGALIGQINRQARSRRNVAHHYDLGNEFYRLFLDREMQYSCAYWPSDDITLDQAQQAKLAHITAKLHLDEGMNVLDIGCGWGGMALYLARHAGVAVHGVTLSTEQLALARRRADEMGLSNQVTFELIDYRDLAQRGDRFDRIVSVGMFEHVGAPQYKAFFDAARNLLKENGVMLLHTIGRMGEPEETDAFTLRYIFPGGHLPALSEIVTASEPFRLMVTDVEMLRLHYAKTLRAWYRRTCEHRKAIEAMYDERFFRMWSYYLAGAAAGFENGNMCVYQIQYARDRRSLPLTRPYATQASFA